MPLITSVVNAPIEPQPPPAPLPPQPPEVKWGKVEDDVRLVEMAEDKSSAIYVIEESPGKKDILYGGTKYSLPMPWMYFIVKAANDATVSSFNAMYILFSKTRLETLEQETLLVPYLSNLFRHGGVCMSHVTAYKAKTPMNVVRLAIGWFWDSPGNYFWDFTKPPPELAAGGAGLTQWQAMSAEEALKISWEVPRFKSVKAAVKGLSFKYYTENFWKGRDRKDCVNDMTGEIGNPF
jgi:hypothetical protein